MSKHFTELEKSIAKTIDCEYTWIARSKDGVLCVYTGCKPPVRGNNDWIGGHVEIIPLKGVFENITWDDGPVRIKNIYTEFWISDVEAATLRKILDATGLTGESVKACSTCIGDQFQIHTGESQSDMILISFDDKKYRGNLPYYWIYADQFQWGLQ